MNWERNKPALLRRFRSLKVILGIVNSKLEMEFLKISDLLGSWPPVGSWSWIWMRNR
jgi:hypothetical protein